MHQCCDISYPNKVVRNLLITYIGSAIRKSFEPFDFAQDRLLGVGC